MHRNEDGPVSPHEGDMDIRLETSNNLDLNVEHDCRSPKVAHVSAVQSSLSSGDEVNMDGVLKIGMEFESDEHAYRFYNKYAGLVGFSVRKDWVNRSKIHGQVVSRKFTCSKEGYRRKDKRDVNVKKHRKETRTGCLAHMIITRQPDGKYRVSHFEADHNHENVNPSNAQKLQDLPSHGMVDVTQVTEVDLANNLEIQSKLEFQLLGRRFGAGESFDYHAIDYDNHLSSGRTRNMGEGEAARLLYYFQRQHFENPSFFYTTQLDIDDKISNIFWADDIMIVDYDHFGDVVCLDTMYRTNKDFRPFVQFIGLNHHKQVVIFGAALLYDETVDSLKWLFRTFIEAMSGKKPKAILTDQDATIIEAIDSVLSETNHRICAWQMYQNALKHLSHVIKDADSFANDLRNCIFHHDDEENFIHAWDAMLDKFSLRQNEWLRWMLREKEKWALAYGRNTFFEDMKGTHLGENLSNNLRNCLYSDLDVLQFFKHFEDVVNEQRYKELEASYDMGRCTPRLMGNVVLLKHASDIYTPKAFEEFQREYEKCLNVVVNQLVAVRWTKDARVESARDSCDGVVEENHKLIAVSRYKDLCRRILKISTRAAESDQAFEFAARQLDEVVQGVEKILKLKPSEEAQVITSSSTGANASESDQAEIFLDRNAIDVQDNNIMKETVERESTFPDTDQLSNFSVGISKTRSAQNVQSPQRDTVISCPTPACISSPSPTLNPVTQGSYNIEASQEESLIRNPFQDSMSSNAQLRQAMDLDVQHPHSSPFIHYDHRYRASDAEYFGSRSIRELKRRDPVREEF
ncbi:hypothetical protein F0562_031277 [Nyssa sinensis]|uniref:Protein FAR1-RELATED SEQUENCE n=1 Tax=Nyssa sinensis TaxID=561372 RepID=A0A5J5ATA7_9ASTE|nr:hypothetical protein F0562_031277 [Nyssa sinensis]